MGDTVLSDRQIEVFYDGDYLLFNGEGDQDGALVIVSTRYSSDEYYDGDASWAHVTLTREDVARLLANCEHHERTCHALDDGRFGGTFLASEFLSGPGTLEFPTFSVEDVDDVADILRPWEGADEKTCRMEQTHVRISGTIYDTVSRERLPEGFLDLDIAWSACVKHTSVELSTVRVTRLHLQWLSNHWTEVKNGWTSHQVEEGIEAQHPRQTGDRQG